MRFLLHTTCSLILFLAEINARGIGKVWHVLPYTKSDYSDHPSWPRLDSSAFEVRTVSGVGRLSPPGDMSSVYPKKRNSLTKTNSKDPNVILPEVSPLSDRLNKAQQKLPTRYDDHEIPNDVVAPERFYRTSLMMRVLKPEDSSSEDFSSSGEEEPAKTVIRRLRREAENETKMEKIAVTKNVREARLASPDSVVDSFTQPISVQFRHRANFEQALPENGEEPPITTRSYQAPRLDFVTSHYRRNYGENRESRDMPTIRSYDDYDFPWYRNAIRDRDYDFSGYRREYYYPDRYRMERNYHTRMPNEHTYYYDRYRDPDFDLYGRNRPTPKPKRIIYYATLPEVVRKPVDLRNYPRPYDGTRSTVSRDGDLKRIPGNVDPSRYRYRNLYDSYDSYSKRSSFLDRLYAYQDDESRRKDLTKDGNRDGEGSDTNGDRKLANQISVRDEGKLPWPVQIGAEINVKDDERIPGRKIFGESGGFERFQSAQLQKAPDATGSSELQSDN